MFSSTEITAATAIALVSLPKDSPTYKYLDAVSTVMADAKTVADMTGLALNTLTSINKIMGDVVTSATAAGAEIGAEIGGEIANAVGAVLDIVPVIGAFVSAVIKIVAIIGAGGAASAAEQEQVVAQGVQGFLATAKVPMIDSTKQYPADIFAQPYENDPSFDDHGLANIRWRPQRIIPEVARTRKLVPAAGHSIGPNDAMSAIGFALTRITEAYGLSDEHFNFLNANFSQAVPYLDQQGPDINRRAIYKKLRVAIQYQLGVKDSNEGQELWPIYIDMLRQDRDAGRLNISWIEFMLTDPTYVIEPNTVEGKMLNVTAPVRLMVDADFHAAHGVPNFGSLAQSVIDMIDGWVRYNNPVTKDDANAYIDTVSASTGLDGTAIKKSLTPQNFDAVIQKMRDALASSIKAATDVALGSGRVRIKLSFGKAGTGIILANPALTPTARVSFEQKAHAAGMSPIAIAAASPGGWSPTYSPKLNWTVRAVLMLAALRKRKTAPAAGPAKKAPRFKFAPGAFKGLGKLAKNP